MTISIIFNVRKLKFNDTLGNQSICGSQDTSKTEIDAGSA